MNRVFYLLMGIAMTLVSCWESYDQQKCEELSMKAYKGFPREAHDFQKNCVGVKNEYPVAVCQRALEKLILGHGEKKLQQEFGPKIMGCFSNNDLKKFLRSE